MQNHRTLTEVDNLKKYSLVLGLLTCWFITHPYFGIRHDSLLYAVQALARLYPEAYKNDIFILYGFQDNYTIFSRLYAFAISWLGLSKATITLMLVGYALWLSASFYIARILLNGKSFWIFLAFLFTLPGNYGYEGILSYGESFLTPRIFAEALTIYSIAFFIQRRFSVSIIFLMIALFFHPLMAGCGLIFLLIYSQQFKLQSILIRLLIIISTLFILAIADIKPFDSLLQVMDEQWYQVVSLRNSHVLIGMWDTGAFNSVVFDFSIILSAIIIIPGQLRRLLSSALVTGIICLLVSWFGADLLHNIFIIQIQLWRAFWLIHWFSYVAMALLIGNWENSTEIERILLLCYITAWFSLDHSGGILALIVLILFYFNQRNNKDSVISRSVVTFAYLLPVVIGSFWLIMRAQDINLPLSDDNKSNLLGFIILLFSNTRIFYVIAFLSFWKLLDRAKSRFPTAIILLLMFLIFSLIMPNWSFRPQFYANKNYLNPLTFNNKIPVDSVVYWQDSVKSTWLTLGRSSYASFNQGAAIPFSRILSIKLDDRLKYLQVLGVKDILSRKERSRADGTPGRPTEKELLHVCHDPELDFVVLSSKFSAGLIDEYYDKEKDDFYYLYDCQYIRRNF